MFSIYAAEFWVLVSFVIFMGIVFYLGVPAMIARSLDARADDIRAELDEARRLREEAQQLLADYQRKAREAEDEAQAIISLAQREAESFATESRKALAESIARRSKVAEEKIARAETQALSDVRAAAVEAAIGAARQILRDRVGTEADASLINSSIGELRAKLN